MRNATRIINPTRDFALIDLFPLVVSILEQNLDVLGSALLIVEGYFLIDATSILTASALMIISLA